MSSAASFGTQATSIDPRVEFYSSPVDWPRDSYKHRFMGRAVHDVGQLMFQEEWTGEEPSTVLVFAIRPRLDAATPPSDVYQAISILNCLHSGYQQRAAAARNDGWPAPMPTPDEWAFAAGIALQLSDRSWAAFKRYLAVLDVLTTVFEMGIVQAALRPHLAGDPETILPSQWINECYRAWFATCQLDPSNPFSRVPVRWGGSWWYVDKPSYYAWIRLTFDVALQAKNSEPVEPVEPAPDPGSEGSTTRAEASSEPEEVSQTAKAAKSKGGAKPRYRWSEFEVEMLRIYHGKNRPISIHAFADRMLEWCSNNWANEPGKSTIRKRIARVLERNGLRLEDEPGASNC